MEELHSSLNISAAIKHLRESRGISQEKLAALAGVDRTYVSMLERGVRNPSLSTIEKIASAFGMKTWELLKYIQDET